MTENHSATESTKSRSKKITIGIFLAIIFGTGLVYFFSNPEPQDHFDYTFRVADNILRGRVAFSTKPPSWLNEFVPFQGKYYSVFPFGSVVTMIPFAVLKVIGVINKMPASFIISFIACLICLFLILIANHYEHTLKKKVLMVLGILFGTWMWANLSFGGAWHLALGFAMLGELGAIYFTVFNRKPLLAGLFFAIAFGNRTEILLTTPIFIALLLRDSINLKKLDEAILDWKPLIKFCVVPFVLGVSTLFYNYVRFNSFMDFGYARIPGVLDEPWYRYGIFSIYYIPLNFQEMLLTPWKMISGFPYIVPTGFGGSILLSSPFLFLTLKFGERDKFLKYISWAAIIILTFLLWIHGNPGGWQYSYRYAMVLLPWIFIILLENSSKKITIPEWLLYGVSFAINIYATYLFLWTNYVKV